jgi:putative ABC transport system permease protein
VVGIANAMLMSVLERFKEIATMKCLGARNETIGFLFIFESLAMGLLGGALGIAGAVLFAVLPGLWIHGDRLLRAFPFGGLAEVAGLGLAAGLILSGVAAIYPAMVASRMAPLEAMRVE